MLRKLCAALATLALGLGLSVIAVAAPAAAHHTTISVSTACAVNGGWTVTWSVVNSENKTAEVTSSSLPDVVPVGTPFAAGSTPNTFSQHVWSKTELTLTLTVRWSNNVTHTDSKTLKVKRYGDCSNPAPELTCTAATVYTGAALSNGVHINMTISQGGSSFQTSAYVDIRQSQDPASESGLVMRITPKSGPQIVLPITNAQKASGVFTFTYSTYLTGAWTVTWVQFNTEDYHFTGELDCGTPLYDAAAALTTTQPSCSAPGALVLGEISNATWPSPAPTDFPVVATVVPGHLFPAGEGVSDDGTTKTFTGTLGAQLDPDAPPCVELAVPVAPALTTVTECGIAGSVSPVPVTGVAYLVDFDPVTGDYTVTATPEPGYYFADDDDQTIVYSGTVGPYVDCPRVVELQLAYVSQCVIYDTVLWSVTNPSELDVLVHYTLGGVPTTHLATPGVTTIGTGSVDSPLTITWGGSDGLAAGTATAVAPAPTPLAAGPSGWNGLSGASIARTPLSRAEFPCGDVAVPVAPAVGTASSCSAPGTVSLVQSEGVVWGPLQLNTLTGFYSATATPAAGYFFMGDDDQSITFTGTVPDPTRVCPTVLTRTGMDLAALPWFGAVLLLGGAVLLAVRRSARH